MSKKESTIVIDSNGSGVLSLIGTQLDNFPIIKQTCKELNLDTGSLLLPQTLAQIDGTLNHNSSFACDCLRFLDVVSFLVYSENKDPTDYFEAIIRTIGYIRSPEDYEELTFGKNSMNDLVFNSTEDAIVLIRSNKTLLALYIYLTVSTIFYK